MNFSIILIALSFLSESILSNYFLNAMFTILTLIVLEPFIQNNKHYYILSFIIGLLYDLVYTGTLLFNGLLFLLIALIIKKIHLHFSLNIISISLITTLIIAIYRIISYLILVIMNYFVFDLSILFTSIKDSLFVNIIYIIFIYLITNYLSKKYKINKVD